MAFASAKTIITLSLLYFSLLRLSLSLPTPTAWPHQFHSILFMNRTGKLQHVDLWYDYPNGRNFNIIQKQLGKLTYDLEWNNGTSYYYTLGEEERERECRVKLFEVGILRPDWLDGGVYLGTEVKDGFLCHVWEKEEFIWYYEDVVTSRPVFWKFFSGAVAHVMTFEVGKVLEDAQWQAPIYCFQEKKNKNEQIIDFVTSFDPHKVDTHSAFMRGIASS